MGQPREKEGRLWLDTARQLRGPFWTPTTAWRDPPGERKTDHQTISVTPVADSPVTIIRRFPTLLVLEWYVRGNVPIVAVSS